MSYRDEKTGVLYPNEDWMWANYENLPEVQQAYPDYQVKKETQQNLPDVNEPPQDVSEFDLPSDSGDTPTIDTSLATISAENERVSAAEAKDVAEKKAKVETAETEQEEYSQTFWDKMMGKNTVGEQRTEEYGELGVNLPDYFATWKADIAEVTTLTKQYNNAAAMKQGDLAKIEDQTINMGLINIQLKNKEKEWNIKLSQMASGIELKMAEMEMKQQRVESARSFVNEAIEDYMYEVNLEVSQFEFFYEQNENKIAKLDQEYQTALQNSFNAAKERQANEKAYAEWIGEAIMNTNGGAGITLEDDYKTVVEKIAKWNSQQVGMEKEYAPTELEKMWDFLGGEEGLGMTKQEFFAMQSGVEVPKNYTDEEFRTQIKDLFSQGYTYEQVLKEINDDPTIRNKDRAKLIASEIFNVGKKEEAGGIVGEVKDVATTLYDVGTGKAKAGTIEGATSQTTAPFFETIYGG